MKTEEPPKEIKEFKDFTSVTAIRKFTQEAMAPVIRSLELQISSMIEEQKELNRRVSKADDVCKSQTLLEQKIQQSNKAITDFKIQQAERKREDDRRFVKLDSANEKLFLQMHSLKGLIGDQNQTIKQINNKNNKMLEMYNLLSINNDKSIKDMQYRYNQFTKDILEMTKSVRQQYQKISSQIEVTRETFKNQRNALEQKTKTLELYLSERQVIQQKFQDLYSKIISNVTKEDFEGYRKSQKVFIQDLFSQMKHQIQEALPHSLREQLPLIQKKLKQVEKIKKIEKNCSQIELEIGSTVRKIGQVSDGLAIRLQELRGQSRQRTTNLQLQLSQKLQKMEQMHLQIKQRFEQRLQQMKMQIQDEVSGIIERQTSQLQKTIQAEVASNRGTNSNNIEYDFSGREQLFWKQIQQAKMVKQKIIARYNKIQQIGQTIDKKIEGYSSKITRIKSDYELFAENMRKEVSGVIKFRDTFLDRLQDVGKILSSYTEALFILSSIFIQKSEEQSKDPKQSVVYITDNDGIIYEYKPQIEKGWIQYRKEKMQIKQFLRSYMYSLISFADDQFSSLSFLNWKDEKPSAFFKEKVLSNYCVSAKRISDHIQKQKYRRNSCYSSSQNQTFLVIDEHLDPTASTKQFSRTIESKLKFEKVLQQGGQFIQNEQNRKGYSIKKSKPASGRPNQKQKSGGEQSRYDQMFLSSRSACRSRISQAV